MQQLLQSDGTEAAREIELTASIFDVPIRRHLFHAEVRRQLVQRQRGTHSTRNRSAVSGGGAKPWRQKGTGRARQGSSRSPQWKGGGVVFGPVPRSHASGLPKRMRRAALCAALSWQRREDRLLLVEDFPLSAPKTRLAAEQLAAWGLNGAESVLLVLPEADPHVERAVRNLRFANAIRVAGLNTYDVLRHRWTVLTAAALAAVEVRLRPAPRTRAAAGAGAGAGAGATDTAAAEQEHGS